MQRKERIGVLGTDKQRLPQDASDPFLRPLFSEILFSLRRLCLPGAIPMTGEDSDYHLQTRRFYTEVYCDVEKNSACHSPQNKKKARVCVFLIFLISKKLFGLLKSPVIPLSLDDSFNHLKRI